MKVIIIEGTDNVGKDTVIHNLTNIYKNALIVHCEKPKSIDLLEAAKEQNKSFISSIQKLDEYDKNDVIIFNRAWYGEFVYGCIYRNRTDDDVKGMIKYCEDLLHIRETFLEDFDVTFITLLSSSVELLSKNDDGKSLSKADKERMIEETRRFEEIFDFSVIKKKHIVYVNDGDEFRSRIDIMNEVLDCI